MQGDEVPLLAKHGMSISTWWSAYRRNSVAVLHFASITICELPCRWFDTLCATVQAPSFDAISQSPFVERDDRRDTQSQACCEEARVSLFPRRSTSVHQRDHLRSFGEPMHRARVAGRIIGRDLGRR